LRDAHSVYEEKGIEVLGVSLDTEESHQQFAAKYDLPFTLLSDTDTSVSNLYGVYGEQTWGDKSLWGHRAKLF
jgi:peroxiredoxin Q/BCP